MQPQKWFAIILAYTVLTMLFVNLAPANSLLWPLRVVLAFTFVIFIPGYCFINLFFAEGKLDFAEVSVLSVALSFSIAGISGLFLGISPLGLNVGSITTTLSGIVVVLSVLAFLKKLGLLHVQLPNLRRTQLQPVIPTA